MLISRQLPPLRGSIVAHMRRMVCEAEIHELSAHRPLRTLTGLAEILSAPVPLASAMRSINFQRSPSC